MQATISGETAKPGICFKTNELLYVLSCIFICLNHEFYGILFLTIAIIGTVVRFGISQNDRRELEQQRIRTVAALDQVANAHLVSSKHKDSVH